MSLLEQDTTRKEQINYILPKPESEKELEAGDNKEYKVETISDSALIRPRSREPIARPLRPSFMERLPKRTKHLGALSDSNASPKVDQYFPQRASGEANSNFFTSGLRSTNAQTNSPTGPGAKIKAWPP